MMNLKFKRLVLVSDMIKSANQFTFENRFNLITGKNNSIGKSSLIKNLFWVLGCEPEFDQNWKSFDCKALLEFSIGDTKYKIGRYNNIIVFIENNENAIKYIKITGKYSDLFANIVGFKAKLPNRSETVALETPPPAFYFLPFYIDQLRSWTSPWNSFENLHQYASWRQTIVNYHTGYLTPEHFNIEEKIYGLKDEKRNADEEIKRINTALEIVEKYVPKTHLALTQEEFDRITNEVESELGKLAKEQETLFNDITTKQSLRYHLQNQFEIAKRAIVEIEEDYKFSVENIEGDEIECPLCGTIHDNSLVSRASILADKQQAEEQVNYIEDQLSKLNIEIEEQSTILKNIKAKIAQINLKYKKLNEDGVEILNLNVLVDSFASRSVQRNVENTKTHKESLSKKLSDNQDSFKKEQKKLVTKKQKENLSELFLNYFIEYITKLDAKGINLSKVKHPSDYNKIFGSGGAAESTRAVLAYQATVFQLIYIVSNEIPAPFVIDTPNQQDQASKNYELIIKLIMNDTPENSQIILCGMDNVQLEPFKKASNVIELNEKKLLQPENYRQLSEEFSSLFNLAQITE